MTKNFSSVVRLVTSLEEGGEEDLATHASSPEDNSNLLQVDNRTITLPASQPLPLSPSRSSQAIRFGFDRVFGSNESQATVYKTSVKDIVESCLLGYHGTVVSFGTECDGDLRRKEDILICKAVEQVFRCLKKSRRSKSRSSTSNLVMLCSHVIIAHEKVHDLLYDYPTSKDQPDADGNLPPELNLVNGSILRASQHKVKGGKVSSLLQFGREMERKVAEFYQKDCESSTPRGGKPQRSTTEKTHHTVFTITVEYSQFGSMNAPVSGNLMFVNMAPSDPLANRQRHTTGDKVAKEVVSLFTFADIVNSLTPNAAIMDDGVKSSGSAFNLMDEVQSSQLPCVPETTSKELYHKSVLTQLLQDSLGGNCKTLFVTYVPELVLPNQHGEFYETLKLASRARLIQNTPNKRDLAEKALMSAYMRGLQEMYGQGVLAKEEKKPRRIRLGHTPVTPFQDGAGDMRSTSKESLSSDDIDTAYDEMINVTEGEKRQQNMEMAATALVAAALEDNEEEGEGQGDNDISSGEDGSDDVGDESDSKVSRAEVTAPLKAKVRLKKKKGHPRKAALMGGGALESSSVTSFTERDVTIDVLLNIIQDPDKGVPRPSVSELKDVQVRKDAGTIFSGAELVRWMVQNIDGVENEGDAETLGQLLLNKGAIFHSEGSKVFASAETLFYYTCFTRPTKKMLSLEEIKNLLAQASEEPLVKRSEHDVLGNVTNVHIKIEKKSHGDGMAVTEVDGEEVGGVGDCRGVSDNQAADEESGDRAVVVEQLEVVEVKEQEEVVEGEKEEEEGEKVAIREGMLLQDVAEGEVAEMENAQYTYTSYQPDQEQDASLYEGYLIDEEQVEQAQAELLKKLEEDSGEPNTAAQEHIPSVQTLEKTTNYPHPLHMAVAIGKSSGVVRQLVMMFGVNKRDEYNRTPLMFAALGNNKSSSCSTLIECGAEVDWQDICGLTALHVACYHGNKAAVNVLLSKKASVCIFDNTDHSAYHWSAVPDDHSCLQLLMSVATPELVMYADRCGLTALHWAINYDHPHHLKILLKMCKEPLRHDSEGRTFMTYAIQQQAYQCIKVLLSAHPSLLTHTDTKGATPLHHVSVHKSTQFLELLFSHKIPKKSKISLDVNYKNRSGRTPLHCAIAYNHLQNATLLVSKGACVAEADNNGKTCMDYANELGDVDRELMLAVLQTGETESSGTQENGRAANSQTNTDTASSKVCIML